MKPNVVIGSDHGGYRTKQAVLKALAKAGYTVVDIGGFAPEPGVKAKGDDYPVYAKEVAEAVASSKNTKGILICGSGTGMVIAANKVDGIRAAMAYDTYSAKMARVDNDANIVCLRGRKLPQKDSVRAALTFLRTEFSDNPRHKRRIKMVKALE